MAALVEVEYEQDETVPLTRQGLINVKSFVKLIIKEFEGIVVLVKILIAIKSFALTSELEVVTEIIRWFWARVQTLKKTINISILLQSLVMSHPQQKNALNHLHLKNV